MRAPLLPILAFLVVLVPVAAQSQTAPGPIQDNSFLIEEAYNQEKGVVQHINTFTYFAQSHDWIYTFTQEWPVPGDERHQLSYTLAGVRMGDFASQGPGIGDVLLNYRYQLVGNGESRVAFAPRLSLILPSGNSKFGRGYGGAGLQTSLPLSTVMSPRWVTHWNLGATLIPHARDAAGDRARTFGYNAGQSVIFLTTPRFNVMLETVFNSAQGVSGPGKTDWSRSLFLSPGVRWAYNFSNGLQIVPGIAMPIGVGPSAGEKGVFVYLSFEHPFGKTSK
jgi:hypothetical protein